MTGDWNNRNEMCVYRKNGNNGSRGRRNNERKTIEIEKIGR